MQNLILSQELLNKLTYRLENFFKPSECGKIYNNIMEYFTINDTEQIIENELFIYKHLLYNKNSMRNWWLKDGLFNKWMQDNWEK